MACFCLDQRLDPELCGNLSVCKNDQEYHVWCYVEHMTQDTCGFKIMGDAFAAVAFSLLSAKQMLNTSTFVGPYTRSPSFRVREPEHK